MTAFYTAIYMDHLRHEKKQDFFLPTERAVRQEILKMGYTPLSIRRREVAWWQREYISKTHKIKILSSVAFHIEAGMSAGKALSLVIDGEQDATKRVDYEPALEVLRRGGQFSEAIEQLQLYDRSVVAMLRAGERVGQLARVVRTAVKHMEAKRNSWKVLGATLGWLSFDMFSSISSVIGTQVYFLPWLEKNGIESKDAAAVQKFHDSVHLAYWLNGTLLAILILATLAIVFLGAGYTFGRGKFRDQVEGVIIRIPFLRSFLFDGALSDTFGIVGRMIQGYSHFAEAAQTAADATYLPGVRKYWETVVARIYDGFGIAQAMRSPLLTRAEQIELEAHHNSEQLALVLLAISEERDDLAKQGTRRIVMFATASMVLFSVLTTVIGIWLLIVQGGGMDATLSSLSGGG